MGAPAPTPALSRAPLRVIDSPPEAWSPQHALLSPSAQGGGGRSGRKSKGIREAGDVYEFTELYKSWVAMGEEGRVRENVEEHYQSVREGMEAMLRGEEV
jgi:hypothetical protein